jgi:cobalt-zinc-cadmium efflux system protein
VEFTNAAERSPEGPSAMSIHKHIDSSADEEERHIHQGHAHAHLPAKFGRAFAIGTTLNLGYVAIQVVFGIAAHSLALLADAGHNLGDVFGLLLAWSAVHLGRRAPTERRTYGMKRSSILAALANAVFLLIVTGGITWEAIRRLGDLGPVASWTIIWVALGGIAVNTATALLFQEGRTRDLNVRGAFLHMAADAAVSAGVVFAGVVILFTGWRWVDPAVSLIVNAVIVWSTWGLLRASLNMALDAVPENINVSEVKQYLASLPAVTNVHHLHIWPLSTTETALTVHLVKSDASSNDGLINRLNSDLNRRFGINHTTIQFEQVCASNECEPSAATPHSELNHDSTSSNR